ncbi:hypothetical protein MERGE_001488 [Pneumocystis wakefieldiae]|uniref:Uncharacterized protein n=1 Tax=Pneumocystis wakefieldiae TaxID=38082 RepID=A0A899G6R6_9ASCO|nr:hypothetical protein MERGE_001488 [Pneumocystis wakefieldiae]
MYGDDPQIKLFPVDFYLFNFFLDFTKTNINAARNLYLEMQKMTGIFLFYIILGVILLELLNLQQDITN